MTIEDVIKNDIIVHCATEAEAERILRLAHKMGLKWSNNSSYINNTLWGVERENTCYSLCNGHYDNLDRFKEESFEIIPSELIQSPYNGMDTNSRGYKTDEKRLDLASRTMQGMLANSTDYINVSNEEMVKIAYIIADELLKQSGL